MSKGKDRVDQALVDDLPVPDGIGHKVPDRGLVDQVMVVYKDLFNKQLFYGRIRIEEIKQIRIDQFIN